MEPQQQPEQEISQNQQEEDDWEEDEQQSEEDQLSLQKQPQNPKGSFCPHYQRECHVQAPCCKIFYPCKLCHDEKFQYKKGCQVERMVFSDVQNVKCLKCEQVQKPSKNCHKCGIEFGQYSCLKCMLYQNNEDKSNDIFHCDQCQMCRRGKAQENFHCEKCGFCRHISQKNNHKCNENVVESNCPICLEILKYSTKYYITLNCGHLIHNECLRSLNSMNCPVCGMAMQKMSKTQNEHIEQLIEQTKDKLPAELKDKKVDIICNECLSKTKEAPFHFYGVKCAGCGTYNTKMM